MTRQTNKGQTNKVVAASLNQHRAAIINQAHALGFQIGTFSKSDGSPALSPFDALEAMKQGFQQAGGVEPERSPADDEPQTPDSEDTVQTILAQLSQGDDEGGDDEERVAAE